MCEIMCLAGRIHDEEQPLVAIGPGGPVRHHEVVENAAARIKQLRVADAVWPQREKIAGHERFEACARVRARQEGLPHMRHIERAGRRARVQMFGQNTGRIMHRHVVTGEGHHARASRAVKRVQRRGQKTIGNLVSRRHGSPDNRARIFSTGRNLCCAPPLSVSLRDFPQAPCGDAVTPFGGAARLEWRDVSLSRVSSPRGPWA